MSQRSKIILFCLMSFLFIGCDQVTKSLAKEHLMNKEPKTYLNDTFRLEYVENTGAFLSFGADWSKGLSIIVFSILPLLFLIGLFIYSIVKSKDMSAINMFSLALIFAGGVGNIIDRILHDRHVIDFMNVGIKNLRTGIFNVADLCVTTGVILLIFCYRKKPKEEPALPNS